MQIVDCIITNSVGPSLSFESDSTGILEIFNMTINFCNDGDLGNTSVYLLTENFFDFNNIDLNISFLNFKSIKNDHNFIDLKNCTGMFANSTFQDFSTFNNISERYLFSIDSSNLGFTGVTIKYSESLLLFKINFIYSTNNIITFNESLFYNSLLGFTAIFIFESSQITMKNCIIRKLGGVLAVIYSKETNISLESVSFESNKNKKEDITSEKYAIDIYAEDDTIGLSTIYITNSSFICENLGNSIYLSKIFIFSI